MSTEANPGTCVRTELITPGPAEALAGLLEVEPPRDTLPPLWHIVYLLERPRQSDLGLDGHPRNGIPAPPGPGFARMFAGGRVTTREPLRIGRPAIRTTWLASSEHKTGRSGQLTFVTVRSTVEQDGVVSIVEESDIVYRAARNESVTSRSVTQAATPRTTDDRIVATVDIEADPTLLFRFSALTYNAHRIHYDRDYAMSEGHPDLLVHGPLQALLMTEALRRAGVSLQNLQFSYRLVSPAVARQRLSAGAIRHGGSWTVQVCDEAGQVTATGELSARRG